MPSIFRSHRHDSYPFYFIRPYLPLTPSRYLPRLSKLSTPPQSLPSRVFQTPNANLNLPSPPPPTLPGHVYLVGTGPGDPNLLTLSSLRLIQDADVILYDRLVSPQVLALIPNHVEKISVGKARGLGTGSQPEIQKNLVHYAKQNKRVVRLKGGDPAIFGRLGDEISYLRHQHNIQVHVIPGITAASAVAAALAFPLTHATMADSIRILTGHLIHDNSSPIGHLVDGVTWVVYMGLVEIDKLVRKLKAQGVRGDLPAVAVQSVSCLEQRQAWATLDGLADATKAQGLTSPVLIVLGDVVAMADGWKAAMGTNS